MILFDVKTTRNTTWDMQLRVKIKECVKFQNDPSWGNQSVYDVIRVVNDWMKERKKDSWGNIYHYYKIVLVGKEAHVYNLNTEGDIKRVVGVIREEAATV